jgi:hypothetical protein
MKYKLTGLLLSFIFLNIAAAQNQSYSFSIEGEVVKSVQIDSTLLRSYPFVYLDSIRIYSHDMQPRSLMRNVKGVLLKNILSAVTFNNENPKVLSEYYIECVATDGYKVVFSWNELFNSETGNHVMIITEKNGAPFSNQDDRIALVSPSDKATGRRYVKWLSKIIIQRVK